MKSLCFFLLPLQLFFSLIKINAQAKQLSDSIYLTARPDSILFDAASTAVIVIDMQNDFGARGSMFDRAGINISSIEKVVNPIANVLDAAKKRGLKIIYRKMELKPDLSDLLGKEYSTRMKHAKRLHYGDTIIAPNGTKSCILKQDTWNTEILPELKPLPEDIVITKNRFNGFYKTTLNSVLRSLGKKYLFITGSSTSICVESTVKDASFRGFMPIVPADCTAEPVENNLPRINHETSLLIIQSSFGLDSSSYEFIKAITLNQKRI